jgi:hypothetical protein
LRLDLNWQYDGYLVFVSGLVNNIHLADNVIDTLARKELIMCKGAPLHKLIEEKLHIMGQVEELADLNQLILNILSGEVALTAPDFFVSSYSNKVRCRLLI